MNFIKFRESYDVARLQLELAGVLKEEWPLHFNTRDFNGDWRSISLRSLSGKSTDIIAHPDGQYQDTPILAAMPYVKEIVDAWHCEKESIRLLSLAPGSLIKPHRDQGADYQDGQFRLHIPIQTNPEVFFTIEDTRLHLAAGECWYMDFSATHSVVNNGTTPRIHLIIDCIRNRWTDEHFAAHGYTLREANPFINYDEATKASMIAELERMGTDTAKDIIAKLKGQQ